MEKEKIVCPIFKLAIFSNATEPRKTKIKKQFLFDSFIPEARYIEAKNLIIESLKADYDMEIIENGIKHIKNKVYKDDWEKKNTILALENYKKSLFQISHNSSFEKNSHKKEIVLNGLCIYVNPEVIIKEVRNGVTFVGAIKFNISKTTQGKIDYDFCRLIVFEYLKTIISKEEKVDFNMIYFYEPLNNTNTLLQTKTIDIVIDDFNNYLEKGIAA